MKFESFVKSLTFVGTVMLATPWLTTEVPFTSTSVTVPSPPAAIFQAPPPAIVILLNSLPPVTGSSSNVTVNTGPTGPCSP